MPRSRSLSLSPVSSRPSTSPSASPPPPVMSIQSLMTTNKLVRYSPYHISGRSFSCTRSTTGGALSEDETTSGSDIEVYLGRRSSVPSLTHVQTDTASTPITARMSRLGLSKTLSPPPIPRSKASTRFTHRRTQSLATPPSYGFILLPQPKPTQPPFTRRHSDHSPRSNTFRTPSPPVAHMVPTLASADHPPTPLTPNRRASFDRMMLVNPAIAAHLKRGGAVNMRTPDGGKRWRVRLQREGGALAGVVEEGEKGSGLLSPPLVKLE